MNNMSKVYKYSIIIITFVCFVACSTTDKFHPNYSLLPEYCFHPEWLSDDLDERFQQMFYYALDNPTVDGPFPPDSDPNDTIPSGNGNDRYLFNNFYFVEQNFIKGSFFLIEPPYSVVGVGLDRYVLRTCNRATAYECRCGPEAAARGGGTTKRDRVRRPATATHLHRMQPG